LQRNDLSPITQEERLSDQSTGPMKRDRSGRNDRDRLAYTAIASESPDGCHADARGSDCSSTVQP
jgi:hypothetical protein